MVVPVDVDPVLLEDPLGTGNNIVPGRDVPKMCALYFEVYLK